MALPVATKSLIETKVEATVMRRLCPSIPPEHVKAMLSFSEHMCARHSPHVKLSHLIACYAKFMGVSEDHAERVLLERLEQPGVTTPLHYITSARHHASSRGEEKKKSKVHVADVEVTSLGISALLNGTSLLENQFRTVQAALRQEYEAAGKALLLSQKDQARAVDDISVQPVCAQRQDAIARLDAGYTAGELDSFGDWCDRQAIESLVYGNGTEARAAQNAVAAELMLPSSDRPHPTMQVLSPGAKAMAAAVVWKQDIRLCRLAQDMSQGEPVSQATKRQKAMAAIHEVTAEVRASDFVPRVPDAHTNTSLFLLKPSRSVQRTISSAEKKPP